MSLVRDALVDPNLLGILRCPRCGDALAQRDSRDTITCDGCAETYAVRDGIPLLWSDGVRSSKLEEMDYDAAHSIDERTVDTLGRQWARLLSDNGWKGGSALEIGAGTGALTKGLLVHVPLSSLIVTDVAQSFLFPLMASLSDHGSSIPVNAVAYDTNDRIFADACFDLIVGRSILHHLVDYDKVLADSLRLLRPGGLAVFYEPVQQGNAILALQIGLILEAHDRGWQAVLSDEEVRKLRGIKRHKTLPGWYPQDRASLAKLEDKYIYDKDEMLDLGKSLGFSRSTYVDYGIDDPSYWPFLNFKLMNVGIPQEKRVKLRWVADVLGDTYGMLLKRSMERPMGFFVFAK